MKKFLCILIMIVILLFPSNIYAKSVNNEKNYANVVFFTYFNGDLEGKKYMEDNYKTIMEYYNGSSETSVKNYLENISYNNFHLYNLFPQINDSTFIPIELSITEDDANNSNYDSIIISDVLKELKLMKYEDQIIMIPHLEPFINERYLKNYNLN